MDSIEESGNLIRMEKYEGGPARVEQGGRQESASVSNHDISASSMPTSLRALGAAYLLGASGVIGMAGLSATGCGAAPQGISASATSTSEYAALHKSYLAFQHKLAEVGAVRPWLEDSYQDAVNNLSAEDLNELTAAARSLSIHINNVRLRGADFLESYPDQDRSPERGKDLFGLAAALRSDSDDSASFSYQRVTGLTTEQLQAELAEALEQAFFIAERSRGFQVTTDKKFVFTSEGLREFRSAYKEAEREFIRVGNLAAALADSLQASTSVKGPSMESKDEIAASEQKGDRVLLSPAARR